MPAISAYNTQIVSLYETMQMSVDEIAEDQGVDPAAVKIVLAQNSKLYRIQCGFVNDSNEQPENSGNTNANIDGFTKEDNDLALQVFRGIARDSDNDALRLRAAEYIRDDHKGRKDIKLISQGPQVNILMINERMIQARKRIEEMKSAKAVVVNGNTKQLEGEKAA